jgi:hypothetical protein
MSGGHSNELVVLRKIRFFGFEIHETKTLATGLRSGDARSPLFRKAAIGP